MTGEPPISGRSDSQIIENVKIGIINWRRKSLDQCSKDSIHLMKRMLSIDPEKRPTATEILNESWIKTNAKNAVVDKKQAEGVLNNLKNFSAGQKLISATTFYIAHQLTSNEELSKLKSVFLKLDKNNDGKLSFEEILEGFIEVFGKTGAENVVELIFKKCEKEKNEFISYDEFIAATIDKTNLLSEKKLEAAFKLFDRNGDGFISPNELKEVLGGDGFFPESYWMSIIKEVDENGDGEISFEEFKHLMERILLNKRSIIRNSKTVNVSD